MARGILVTHRDGSTSYVTKENLNMPKWNFQRLNYKRMLGKGPVKHRQGDRSLGTFNCWIHGLDEGQEHFSAQWDWPVLWSLTKTLSFKPTNPHFIVHVEAEYTKRHYEKADLSNVWQTHKQATLKWYDEWQDQNLWGGGDRNRANRQQPVGLSTGPIS